MESDSWSLRLRVFLVDDGSTDGSGQAVHDAYPDAEIIRGTGDLYWCGGMRLAFDRAQASADHDYLLWLNDDTLLGADTLVRMVSLHRRLVEGRSQDAIVVGSIVDPITGQPTYGGLRRIGPLPFTRTLKPSDQPQRCHTLHGNCVLVPSAIAESLGNLDEALTHGRGDIDYGLRAARHGFEVWTCPGIAGTCVGNPIGEWRNLQLPLARRLQALHDPKYAIAEKMAVARRHYGLLWFLSPLAVYAFIVVSHPIGLLLGFFRPGPSGRDTAGQSTK